MGRAGCLIRRPHGRAGCLILLLGDALIPEVHECPPEGVIAGLPVGPLHADPLQMARTGPAFSVLGLGGPEIKGGNARLQRHPPSADLGIHDGRRMVAVIDIQAEWNEPILEAILLRHSAPTIDVHQQFFEFYPTRSVGVRGGPVLTIGMSVASVGTAGAGGSGCTRAFPRRTSCGRSASQASQAGASARIGTRQR
jgi:hypothetical protein